MVQRPGGDSVSVKVWWMLSYMPCSQLWAGRTQTIRWVGQMGTSLPSKFSEPKGHWERPRMAQMRTGCNYPEQGTQHTVSHVAQGPSRGTRSIMWHRVHHVAHGPSRVTQLLLAVLRTLG